MDGQDEKPNITIVFHDEDAPVGLVMSGLRHALRPDYELKFLEIETASGASGGDRFLMQLQLKSMQRIDREAAMVLPNGSRRVDAHCDLLDSLNVPNGDKSIAIALHAHWSEDHRARFGNPAKPATVKRWRTERSLRRSRGSGVIDVRGRSSSANQLSRTLRRHHAIRCNASGARIRHQYRRALVELDTVNAGAHALYGKPDAPLTPFSYETFRRDCQAMKNPSQKRPASRRRKR